MTFHRDRIYLSLLAVVPIFASELVAAPAIAQPPVLTREITASEQQFVNDGSSDHESQRTSALESNRAGESRTPTMAQFRGANIAEDLDQTPNAVVAEDLLIGADGTAQDLAQTTEPIPSLEPTEENAAPPSPQSESNSNFAMQLSGEVRIDVGLAFAGQGDTFFDTAGNSITLPRDFASLPSAGASVAGGNTAAAANGGAVPVPFGTGTLASFSGAVSGAATALNGNFNLFPGAGIPNINNLQDLASSLAANSGLGAAGTQFFLQAFANAGINPANPNAVNAPLLAGFHQNLSATFANAGDAKIVIVNPADVDDNLAVDALARLSIDTTFTGEDLLTLSWLAFTANSLGSRTGAPETVLETWANRRRSENFLELDEIYYRFPIGDVQVYVGLKDLFADDIVPSTANFQDGALGEFFTENPLSYDYSGGTGIGANYQISEQFNIAAAFLASDGFVYDEKGDEEIFSNSNTLFTQLTYQPNDRFTAAFTFNRAFNPDYLGLEATVVSNLFLARQKPTIQHAIALNLGYEVNDSFNISGWLGHEWSETEDAAADFNRFSWALNFGFPNLFVDGNYGGFSIGAFPYVTRESGRFLEADDSPIVAQVFYRVQLTDQLSIQPGLLHVANPTGNIVRENIWLGSVQAQLTF